MAQIDIRRAHNLSSKAAEEAVNRALVDLKTYGVAGAWDAGVQKGGALCTLSGRGITGSVRVEPEHMHLQINLPFLLRPMAGAIRTQIDERLDQVLGPAQQA